MHPSFPRVYLRQFKQIVALPQASGTCPLPIPNETLSLPIGLMGIQHSPNRPDQLQQLMRLSAMIMIHRQLLPSNRLHKQFISVPPLRCIASRKLSPSRFTLLSYEQDPILVTNFSVNRQKFFGYYSRRSSSVLRKACAAR